jgi:uncharacterized protein (TIGR02117 family)
MRVFATTDASGWLLPVLRTLCSGLCLAAAASCSTIPTPPDDPPAPKIATILVVDRGWHTDIGLPMREIEGPLGAVERRFPGAQYLVFGFGDRRYLLHRTTTFGDMLLALLPGRGALLVTALQTEPSRAFGRDNIVALHATRAGARRLQNALWRDLVEGSGGDPQPLGDGPYPSSLYFASAETYDGVHTCNTWTAERLRVAGLPATVFGALFAGQVMKEAHRIGGAETAAGPLALYRQGGG